MNNYDNKVELLDYMGSDNLHCLSAWASTFLELDLDIPTNIENRVDVIVDYIVNNSSKMRSKTALLEYLAAEKHESPFRMSAFVFGATTDIATHIQKLKHAVILEAENGESAKYKELKEDKMYLPKDWLDYGVVGEYWYNMLKVKSEELNQCYHDCFTALSNAGMSKRRVKESSRFFKMYNSQINTINKMSFAGVMLFLSKRGQNSFAQDEISELSIQMVECIKNIPSNPFKLSLQAFGL